MVPVGDGTLDLRALAASNGGTHFVVIRYDFRPAPGADFVSLYRDPAGTAEPAVPDAKLSVATSDLFITHQGAYTHFTFSGSGHVPGAIDEIRWATTFGSASPTPAPEPAQAALLAVGGASLLLARRRTIRQGSMSSSANHAAR